ncbi:hypothetical protein R2R70_02460 [Cobetia sp. SIMBA_158]|uniref:hypothetical protein n=1 Tax=Cobetia sp. SIMBA_158 TaxID=3081617 RepID=UPI00397EAC0B
MVKPVVKSRVTHELGGKPIKHVPLAELPENLMERFKGRRGIELYEGFSTKELDAVAMDAIPRPLLQEESALMSSKWFDYRTLHPWQATAVFLEAYRSEHAWVMRKREDVKSHWFHKGIKVAKLHNAGSQQLVSIWKARQAADRVGCPYDFYCRELLDWAEKRNWTHLPRINQVYSEDHIEVVKELWERGKRDRLRVATEPCFEREAGDDWYQRDYRDFLIEQVKMRAHREFSLAALIYKHGHLSEFDGMQNFGQDMVEKARKVAGQLYAEHLSDSPSKH